MALTLFPEEVWEAILDKLYDSKDVSNSFEAFPELEEGDVLKTKRHLWMFDRVIGHVFPWLKQKELLACRHVCKQWHHGVDNFLEHHPRNRAYSHESQITGQYWIPDASQGHYSFEEYFHGLKGFNKIGNFDSFLQLMEAHPPERNPFVGRSIEINDYRAYGDDNRSFWNKALHFLRKFGSHIWFLKIASSNTTDLVHFCQFVIISLGLVPNLKSFKLDMPTNRELDLMGAAKFLMSRNSCGPLPPLPQLESLDLTSRDLHPIFVALLVRNYSTQIRRLQIQHYNWRPEEYSNIFPNLTEFNVMSFSSIAEISPVLVSLHAPKLWKLHLGALEQPNVIENGVGPLLTRFPMIHTLVLYPFLPGYGNWAATEITRFPRVTNPVQIPSLKSLFIFRRNHKLHINLLQCFPNLEYISILAPDQRMFVDKKIHISKVWELLPRLQQINHPDLGMTYSREKYEHLKRSKLAEGQDGEPSLDYPIIGMGR